MISKLSIRNFKCLRDVQIDLERITVFVGPNASGKSSILQALHVMCRAFREQEAILEQELAQAVTRNANESVELAVESEGRAYRYRGRSPLSPPKPTQLGLRGAQPGQSWNGQGRGVASGLGASQWTSWPPNQPSPAAVPLSVLLRLETSKLIEGGLVLPDPSAMASNGAGLHSALANMALND